MLKIIGVPIGNIEDISIRAIKNFFSIDVIVAEDTRNFIKLRNILAERFKDFILSQNLNLNHQPILISYREENHYQVSSEILKLLKDSKTVGLITDAGMPTISDPGSKLILETLKNNIEIEVIPGPTAIETALSISGFSTAKFTFLGFLPKTKSKIERLFSQFPESTLIFYESPYRIIKTLRIISEISQDFKVSASNDLTKKFEKTYRGNILEVIEKLLKEKKILGEWVIVISNERE